MMGIVVVKFMACDEHGCEVRFYFNEALAAAMDARSAGWTFSPATLGMKTFCPAHSPKSCTPDAEQA